MEREDDFDSENDETAATPAGRRKILLIVIPAVIAIGLAVGLYFALNHKYDGSAALNYSVVKNMTEENGKEAESVTVFYDLPEIKAQLKNDRGAPQIIDIRLSIELSKVEDVATVEKLLPRITDSVISHTVELTPDEVAGSAGLYWLREELLYRMNLLVAPVKINNLNFKKFEIQTNEQ